MDPLSGDAPSSPEPAERPVPDVLLGRVRREVLDRTWEMELLISGGVLFALIQLSGALDEAFSRLEAHLALNSLLVLSLSHTFGKLILYSLIASFILHLAARGYWIGLVGLNSVFPRGPRWDQVKLGPIARRFYEARMSSLPWRIERVNAFCSVIFSFAALLVLVSLTGTFMALICGLLAFAVSNLFFDGQHLFEILLAGLGIFTLFSLLGHALDKTLARRWDPAGAPARAVEALHRFNYRLFLEFLYRPIAYVLFTNVRKKTIYPLFYLVFFGIFGLVLLTKDGAGPAARLAEGYVYFPEGRSERAMSYAYYESQRPEGEIFPEVPSIQDDVVRDSYIELFIPYRPLRHDPAVRKLCPGVEPLADTPPAARSTAAGKVLRCLAGIHRVSLDGKPLAGLDFHFYTQPRTGVRGIRAYISTEGLARGSHLLRVEPVPRVGLPLRIKAPPREPYLIRFWI